MDERARVARRNRQDPVKAESDCKEKRWWTAVREGKEDQAPQSDRDVAPLRIRILRQERRSRSSLGHRWRNAV